MNKRDAHKNKHRHDCCTLKCSGFTLVELMVVVAVIGILVAIAIPVYRTMNLRAEQATIEYNLRALDGAIMMYHAKNGHYPVSDTETSEAGIEWIINSPWRENNSLASFVAEFKAVRGESYAIYGKAYAKEHAQVDISSNRAFIVLESGEMVAGHEAKNNSEHFCLASLPWKDETLQELPKLSGLLLNDSQYGVTITKKEPDKIILGGQYTGEDNSIVIPSNVIEIGARLFDSGGGDFGKATKITSITFEQTSSLTVIGRNAFRGAGLTEVELPNGLLEIGNYAFNGNPLTEITIPNSVKTIGIEAFKGGGQSLSTIKKITIGDGVQIGDSLFQAKTNDYENNDFRTVYTGGDGGAGTYVFIDGVWQKQQD
jgi:prepilin-type N-terminal cleavage/methylation domain-containing protein